MKIKKDNIKKVNIYKENNVYIKQMFILYKDIKANFILFIYFYNFKRIICEQIFMNRKSLFNYLK